MNAKQIRESVNEGGAWRKFLFLGSFGATPLILVEIAAQLAEIKEILAARKSNDWTTPTTDAARKEE
jgi:hypothetical protein